MQHHFQRTSLVQDIFAVDEVKVVAILFKFGHDRTADRESAHITDDRNGELEVAMCADPLTCTLVREE